ncbi:MAG: hypothetical protein ACTHM1_11915 [Solirubrobacteraceae bacterium]
MNDKHYAIARGMAGKWVGSNVPVRYTLTRGIPRALPSARTAVYITEKRSGRTAYVGQTRQGTARRLAQHVRYWNRATTWAWVWVVPLLDETPNLELNRIEGRIGEWLRPVDSRRLPKP